MFLILYDISIRFYAFLACLISPINKKAKSFIEGRKNWRLKYAHFKHIENSVWFHAASLGEYELSIPIIKKIKTEKPNLYVLVTFYSPSGFENRKSIGEVDFYGYIPFDYKTDMEEFVSVVKPKMVFFAKYDLWFHCLSALFAEKIPVILFSGTFRQNQLYFKSYAKPYLNKIKLINHFFVTDEESKKVLNENGISQVTVNGDSRFEKVFDNALNRFRMPEIEEFIDGDDCMVVGSSWNEDIELIAQLANQRKFPFKLIIAPHDISEQTLKFVEKSLNKETIRYSKLREGCASCAQVLLIDNIGLLSNLYQYAKIAYVGGAFKQGLHNILEPIAYRIPVFFGSKYEKYPEAHTAINKQIAFSVSTIKDFETIFYDLISDSSALQRISNDANQWLESNKEVNKSVVDFSVAYLE
ncbi:MAG: glycosyltransferase N-terminal domain-containing protein [Cytophagales bacterium]